MHLETPTTSALAFIPSGRAGIVETLRAMAMLVKEGKKNIRVRERAQALTVACAQKDYACEVRALHAFVRDAVRYIQDVNGVETIAAPEKTLETMSGDCDDKSILLAALLESIGHPCRFVAVGYEPGIYEHVYVETKIGPRWIPLETTEPVAAGWEPPNPPMKLPFYI